jgi:hypothetical protein
MKRLIAFALVFCAGDRNKQFLGVTHGGEQTLAEKLVAQLKKAMQR